MNAWTRMRGRFSGSAPAEPSAGRDLLKWTAAAFALVATATAEYELARAIGMNEWVAAAVPGALDAYVVRALRAHREVLTAVLAMVAVNAASHLVTADVLPVAWPLITAVSAIAPLVLWRVHALGTPGQWRARKLWGVPAPVHASTDDEHSVHDRAPDNPEPPGTREHPEGCVWGHAECTGDRACTVYNREHAPGPVCSNCGHTEHGEHGHMLSGDVPGDMRDCPLCSCAQELREMCGLCEHTENTGQAHVRAQTEAWGDDWMDVHDSMQPAGPKGYVGPKGPVAEPTPVHAPYDDHVHVPEHTRTRHLTVVPDAEHTRTADDWNLEHVATGVLEPEDTEHMERARELFHTAGSLPTFRALKDGTPGMGTPRAKRIRAALKTEAGGES